MIMKVLSVSGVLATSGSSSSSAFLIPAASSNNMMLPTSTSTSSRLRPQIISCYAREPTRIYYRDDDNASIDAMLGVERDQLPLPTTSIHPEDDYQTASSSDFRSRMRRILVQQQKNASSSRRSNTLSVTSLEEYASVIEEGRREGRLVVVRFHATWCKVNIIHIHPLCFIDVTNIPNQTNISHSRFFVFRNVKLYVHPLTNLPSLILTLHLSTYLSWKPIPIYIKD